MKTESDIKARIKELLVLELDKRVAEASLRLPHRCSHNYRHSLDSRPLLEGELNPTFNRITKAPHLPVVQNIGLCLLEKNGLAICDDELDAKRCPDFSPIQSKQELYEQLMAQLGDRAWVMDNIPELYALLWVLEHNSVPVLPWWKKIWFWMLRIKVEPALPYEDPVKLLDLSP